MSMREQDLIHPSEQVHDAPEIDSRYVKKRIGLEDELRLGPSRYKAMQELPPKNKNFREKMAKKGRPSEKDALYGNFKSKHTPHILFREDGTLSLATGAEVGLGLQMNPETGEMTISGQRLNLNFAEIDIRAGLIDLIVGRLINLLVTDGNFRANVSGQTYIRSGTMTVHADRSLRVESQDIAVTTDVVQIPDGVEDLVGAALASVNKPKGKFTLDTEVMVLSATKQIAINSDDILWGHENKLSPLSPINPLELQPMRGVARQFDKTTHFCPYMLAPVDGWITSGSEHVSST